MTVSHPSAGRLFLLMTLLAGLTLGLLLGPGLPASSAFGAVTFSPKRVPQGGKVTVKAGPAGKARVISLNPKATFQAGGIPAVLGEIPAGKAGARLKVPVDARPGRYFVIACAEGSCKASKKKLTVVASGKADRRKFRLRYIHIDRASQTRDENDGGFAGKSTWKQSFVLKSAVKVKKGKGKGPIRYTRANYLRKRVGEFASQAGGLGSDGSCLGTSTTNLTATKNGTARVRSLSVRGRKISLDFTPGPVFKSRGRPAEMIRSASTFSSGGCADGEDGNWNRIFLNDFGNFYNARGDLERTTAADPAFFVRLSRGWKVKPNRKKGFAKLVLKKKLYGALLWKDTFIIDRL